VAQASSSWRELINKRTNWSFSFKTGSPKQRKFKRFQEPGGILGFLTIVVAMLLWNWKLLLALLVGVGVMLLVYSMQEWNWQVRWSEVRKLLNSANHRLALAVMSGGIATVSTYMAVAIWLESNSHWIAAGAILQALGTLLTLILLIWQIVNFYGDRSDEHLDKLLLSLTEEEPLKRLIALRQLIKFVSRNRVDSSVQQNVGQCLRLLISREKEEVIREAAFEGLQTLEGLQPLVSNAAKPLIPVSVKAKHYIS
jgi:hypothetical protein